LISGLKRGEQRFIGQRGGEGAGGEEDVKHNLGTGAKGSIAKPISSQHGNHGGKKKRAHERCLGHKKIGP